MRQTKIIYPLDKETPDSELKMHKNDWHSIKSYLNDQKEGNDNSIDQLLLKLHITEENYLLAIS